MKTAVIYARYSSDSQTEQSIEGQVRVCKQFAEKNDLLVVDQYIDRATTGTNDNRAAFQQMLRDSKKAQWGAVIVYKLDRFARNKYESVVNRKKLKDNGVELVSAMENIPDTPEGKLFLAVIEGFNEYFSEDLKQKVNRGLRESWLKGNATGGLPPFGYVIKDKKYVIDEAEAEIVREIFMKYAQGYKAVAIAEDLKARNVRRKCGKHINHKYVYVILHDKRYIGEVTHKGTTYYNIFPPIIAKEVWNQVDAINQENKIAPSRKKEIFDYILSGKLICGTCKHRMSGESGTSRNGEIHYYYVCLSKRRGKADCDCKAVKKQELEDYVIDATVSMLQRNSIITKIAETIVKVHEKIMRDNSGLQILIKKREETKRAADNIIKAIEQGIIMDFTKDRLATLQDELNRLDIEINKEAQKTYAHVTVDDVEKYLLSKVFEDPDDIKTRKLLVNTFIRDILWYGDHIVITYNFQEYAATDRFCKSYVEQLEKQVGDASRSASSFPLCSYKFRHSAPPTEDSPHVPRYIHISAFPNGVRYSVLASLVLTSPVKSDMLILVCTTTASSCAVHAHASRHFCASPFPAGVRCKASPVVRTTDGRLAFSAKNMRLFHGLIFFRYIGSLPPPADNRIVRNCDAHVPRYIHISAFPNRRTTGSSEIVTLTCLDISISRHSLTAFAIPSSLCSSLQVL